MTQQELINIGQWVFLLYFVGINSGYLTLNFSALLDIRRFLELRRATSLPSVYSNFELPISLLVPAFNEEVTVGDSVRALLQLEYGNYEIIVINDGSTDDTLEVLTKEFSLRRFPEAYRMRIPVKPVNAIYCSTLYPNLRVIDKQNGGKADALNAGLNAARYPVFCSVDADSVLQRDSLARVVQPFLEDRNTIAGGGTIRIANGCKVTHGFLEKVGLPKSWLAKFQVIEYLRAFLFGRLGWEPLNALLIISGAFGLFRKEAVMEAGGYRTDTVGEDMELVVRLHRHARMKRKPYRITFVPDPICWTEVPEKLSVLQSQRIRWQRGLVESLAMNMRLCMHPRGGIVGWVAFPFMLIFEMLGPLLEVFGYVFIILAALAGWISYEAFFAFLGVAFGMGMLLSTSALLLEEMSFHMYPKLRQTATLFMVAVLENLGYRQLIAIWRLVGLARSAVGAQSKWGRMQRKAAWGDEGSSSP
jgi:cellulose synthase/poly-beta-1,6-N-acetylglucosamine synthase-like glycosyltransferase